MIKIAIADDHKIFRDGLKLALSTKPDLKLLWEAEDGKQMLDKIEIKKPDVILMDLRMPELDGINGIQLIRKKYEDIKIIVLSMFDDEKMISTMMEMGANAYLTKTTDPTEIYTAIVSCIKDDFYFNDLVNNSLMGKLIYKRRRQEFTAIPTSFQFSEKELKILQLLANDKTTEEIADIVFLSQRTVESIRNNMKTKLGVKTVGGLLMYAVKNKLI